MKENKTFTSLASRCLFLAAVLALVAAIALNVISLALPNWLHYKVDLSRMAANASSTGLDYNNRTRGVFLTCLTETAAPVLALQPFASQVKFGTCFDMDLGNLAASSVGYIGPGAWVILMLRRLHLGLHLASGFCLCLALLVCVACAARRSLDKLFVSAGISLMAAGTQFGAHVAFNNILMRELLPPGDGTAAATAANIYNAWPAGLQMLTQVSAGASYYIALGAFSTCLGSAAACMICAAFAQAARAAAAAAAAAGGNAGFAAPSGSAGKVNGAARMDNASNLSGGANVSVQSGGRLPRIPVYQSYGAY